MKKLNIDYLRSVLIYFFPLSIVLGNFFINLSIILLGLVFFFLLFSKKEKIFDYLTLKELGIFTFFIFILILSSIVNSENSIYTLTAILKIIFSLFFSLSISSFFIKNKKIDNFLKYLFVIIIIISIDGVFQFFFEKNIIGNPIIKSHGNRLTGFFGDEAVLGSFISKLSILTFYYIFIIKKYFFKALVISLFLIIVVIMSNERMASLLVIFSFVNWIIFLSFKKKTFKYFLFIPVILLIIFSFIYSNKTISDQFVKKTDAYIGGITRPFDIINSPHGAHWVTAFKIFVDYPLIGSGLKNFRQICQNQKYSTENKFDFVRCSTHPHNIFFEFLSETGILGTLSFIIFVSMIIFSNINFIKNSLFFSSALSIIVFLWPLGTSGSFFSSWNGSFFWLFLGILISIRYKIKLNAYKK